MASLPPRVIMATTSKINPKMKLVTPNGMAKHGFFNLAVAHPKKDTKRSRTPNAMIGVAISFVTRF